MSSSKDIDQEQLVKTIKAHIAKGDKAAEKANDHYIAAGQHLAMLKKEHGGSWAEWEELLKTRIGIGRSRASELMQIADGTKTVEQVRADGAERKAKERAKSLRDVTEKSVIAPAPITITTNDVDPEDSAEDMKQRFAEEDGDAPAAAPEPEPEPEVAVEQATTTATTAGGELVRAWEEASENDRHALFEHIGLPGVLTNISDNQRRELTARVVKNYVANLPPGKKRRAARASQNRMIEKLLADMPVQGNA